MRQPCGRRRSDPALIPIAPATALPGARALRALDAAVAVWVVAWIGLGVAIGINVHHLTDLSHTVASEGGAVEAIGRALGGLGSVPFVGGSIGRAAQQIEQAGASAMASGQSSASAVSALSWLLAVAVALLPSVPVLGFYLPLRVRRSREARALARAARVHGGDPRFRAFLAQRAVASLPYRSFEFGGEAWSDLDRDGLAAAELCRLGINPELLRSG